MNHSKALIVGIIFVIVGGFILFQLNDKFKDNIPFHNNYLFGLFILGYLIQSILDHFGYSEWYCIGGLCSKQINDITIDSKIRIDDEYNLSHESESRNMIKIKNTTEIVEGNQNQVPFIPSEQFTGLKEGYVFKKDINGLGYYLD